jgi:hypothetical protein
LVLVSIWRGFDTGDDVRRKLQLVNRFRALEVTELDPPLHRVVTDQMRITKRPPATFGSAKVTFAPSGNQNTTITFAPSSQNWGTVKMMTLADGSGKVSTYIWDETTGTWQA